jgi:hypothetical protein
MTNFEDHELAQAIHRELLELRARSNVVTPVELSVLAARAELPENWQPDESRASVDEARTKAWLAICRLASEMANNEAVASESPADKVGSTDPLWSVAIDSVEAWMTEAG